MAQQGTVVGVFSDHDDARKAIRALKDAGFSENQIGVASSNREGLRRTDGDDAGEESYAGEGAAAGLATGAGLGALWGLGIIAGVLPAVGPAIAGGTLAAILSSAAAGAVAAGLGGALIGLGLSKEEAEYYDSEFQAGRTVVTVTAAGREAEAESVLREYGGYDISREGMTSTSSAYGVTGEGMRDQGMTGMVGEGTSAGSTSNAWMAGEGTSTAGMLRGTHAESESTTGRPESVMGGSAMGSSMHGEPMHTEHMHGEGERRMTAYEEQLHVEKRPVEKGDVHVRKEVHTEHKTIDVPVQREEVVIERRAPSGDATGSIEGHQEIHIPVREEEVNVEKVPVAKEEVVVGKRKVQDTEHVRETLRKEDIKVDADPDVPVRNRRDETR